MPEAGRLPLGDIINPERVEKTEFLAPSLDGAPDVPLIVYRPAGNAAVNAGIKWGHSPV